MIDLDDIPEDQTEGFPPGVSEKSFDTVNEGKAFLEGLRYAQDLDVSHGVPFVRNDRYVVRVRVGDFA
jgi:hypothetical protein